MRGLGLSIAALCAAAALAVPASASGLERPTPGAAGIGDRLFPTLGNGGYDVKHYDLDLRYETAVPSQGIDGTATIFARATQSLSRFDLDFAGDSVGSVAVNGRPARFARDGDELVITPRRPLRKGRTFVVQVRHYTAHPREPNPDELLSTAFFITPDGSATAGQPDGAHVFMPSNDHPRDKASFTIRFDVPAGETALGNGVLVSKWTARRRTH
jgi:aminopeptidase N